MKLRTAIPTALLALSALAACTPQQIEDAITASEIARGVRVEERIVEEPITSGGRAVVEATCHSLTYTVTGLPEAADVFLSLGSQPPTGFTVGEPNPWSTQIDGATTVSMHIAGYDSLHPYDWRVDVISVPAPGQEAVTIAGGHVECPAG